MQRDERVYLADMLKYAQEVVDNFTAGFDRRLYGEAVQTRRSVERSVQLIGEAAKHVSDGYRDAHPDIPWRKIIGQRNVLVTRVRTSR